VVAIGFAPDAEFEGRIMEELAKLERLGTIRILDLLFVQKDPDSGDVVVLDVQGDDLGGIVGALLGFAFEGSNGSSSTAPSGDDHAFGLTQDDIEDVAAALDPGHSAGFLLVEHLWARDFKRAAEEAGGTLLGEGFLTPQAMAEVAPELAGMAEALNEVEAEGGS
jgi:uncharacterized membrane protein